MWTNLVTNIYLIRNGNNCHKEILLQESKQFLGHIYSLQEMSTILVRNIFVIRKWPILVRCVLGTRNMQNSCDKYICNKKY